MLELAHKKTADMDVLRYSPDELYYKFGPVHMCLYFRARDNCDWDLLVGPELLSPIPESDQISYDCVSQKPTSRVLWRDRTSQRRLRRLISNRTRI